MGGGHDGRVDSGSGTSAGKERCSLHTTILALARLGHAKVKRVVPAQAVLLRREQPVRLEY